LDRHLLRQCGENGKNHERFRVYVPELQETLFLEKEKNIRMGNPPLRIEVLTSIDGVEFSECYKNKQTVLIDDVNVCFISLEDLKKNKKESGRYRDLDDLKHL
jgi:hypothetical protein